MKRRAYVYFALVFALGIIIGAAGVYSYGWYSGHWRHGSNRHRVIDYLQRKLELSQAQTQQLQQILRSMDQKESELRDQVAPQFQAIREEARTETRKILNSQQLAKFNEMAKRWDANRRKAAHQPPSPAPK
ncbi:MAG TPA: periplasmic heavy metal sensor [Terriglobia bacterium]|nr:periplasmic heavy metal sensor [Terriglobia bacterium]